MTMHPGDVLYGGELSPASDSSHRKLSLPAASWQLLDLKSKPQHGTQFTLQSMRYSRRQTRTKMVHNCCYLNTNVTLLHSRAQNVRCHGYAPTHLACTN